METLLTNKQKSAIRRALTVLKKNIPEADFTANVIDEIVIIDIAVDADLIQPKKRVSKPYIKKVYGQGRDKKENKSSQAIG